MLFPILLYLDDINAVLSNNGFHVLTLEENTSNPAGEFHWFFNDLLLPY